MINETLANQMTTEALDIINSFYADEGIHDEPLKTTLKNLKSWSSRINFPNPELMAAAAISGEYQEGISLEDIESWRNFYFGGNLHE